MLWALIFLIIDRLLHKHLLTYDIEAWRLLDCKKGVPSFLTMFRRLVKPVNFFKHVLYSFCKFSRCENGDKFNISHTIIGFYVFCGCTRSYDYKEFFFFFAKETENHKPSNYLRGIEILWINQ